jgi:hypothetical protein
VNLTTRGKWLMGIAAAVAAYVIFGPRDSDPVDPARRSGAPVTHTAHSVIPATGPAPIARTFLALAHRVVDPSASGSLFAAHSWYVAPPPPPPAPPVETVPAAPPTPVTPPFPFTYMGSYAPNGQPPVFFLTRDDKVYDVHVGDTLDGTYHIDSFADGQLVFTYIPLNQQQQLMTGGVP